MPRRKFPLFWIVLVLVLASFLVACEDLAATSEESNGQSQPSAPRFSAMPARPANLTTARVSRVIDGDTLDLADGRRIRLLGINTPERDQAYYQQATQYLQTLVEDQIVGIEFDTQTIDQFDRTLAYLWVNDRMVNIDMVLQGYADTYIIPPNERYASVLRQAEETARQAGLGIWKAGQTDLEIRTIFYDAPGRDADNPNGEWIEIQNVSNRDINMNGFTLQDSSSSNLYTFGNFTLGASEIVTIYSGCGTNTRTELYWCAGALWNNDGDSAMLRDNNDAFVDSYSYSR
jgi:micrococcal nuclease